MQSSNFSTKNNNKVNKKTRSRNKMLEFGAEGPEFKTQVDVSTCFSLLSCITILTHYSRSENMEQVVGNYPSYM
jgi:hypothetical protein